MTKKTAVILAGGKGTRLHPYTVAIPKPLVPIGDKPIIEIMIKKLSEQGFGRIVITVNHQADIIMAYLGNGRKWNVDIEYSLESIPLGTMGPLKLIKNLPDSFLVMNGDVLTDLGFDSFLEAHIQSKKMFTISSHRREQKNDYGVLEIEGDRLIGFKEKPVTCFNVSMGIYAASKGIVDYIPSEQYFGFDDLMLKMLNEKVDIGVFEHKGYWMDIGRPDDYAMVTNDLESGKLSF